MDRVTACCLGTLAFGLAAGCNGSDGREGAMDSDRGGVSDQGAGRDSPSSQQEDSAVPAELRGEWRLEAIRGEAVEAPEGGRVPTLVVGETADVGGFGGVNQWGSMVTAGGLAEGEFTLARITSTLMAGPREAMQLEDRYFGALRAVRRYDDAGLASGELVLQDEAGEELLRFSRAE